MTENIEILVIVGSTGSGKSDLAVAIAKKFNGEIICADSMTIYRGLDIGTAKPTETDRRSVRHWALDLIEPNEKYSAFQFKKYAEKAIIDIKKRGKLPIIVGGTGLYVDSIILDYSFPPVNVKLRSKLQSMTVDEMLEYCRTNNIHANITPNKRHNVSSVLNALSPSVRKTSPEDRILVVGLTTDKIELQSRIEHRVRSMIDKNVVREATIVADKYGWSCYGLLGNIYPLVKKYVQNDLTLNGLIDAATKKDYQLARRQMTWLRRHKFIKWIDRQKAYEEICNILSA